jgi:glycerol-3-phosphate dehydrogenase
MLSATTPPKKFPMSLNRTAALKHLAENNELLDIVVIGGGATGASVALDAAARGLKVALLEQHDFGKGTSSRSTKLIHGGVRYLAQGNITLVRDALHERTRLRNNAPHVVHEMSFIVPCANKLQQWWYGFGFKVYDWLSGKSGFRKSCSISQAKCLELVPTFDPARAVGGVLYSDGQFDDSRLLLNLLQTAAEQGATIVNYAKAEQLLKNGTDKINAVLFTDQESGTQFTIRTRCVVNATGPFCDSLRAIDNVRGEPMISASQGVHIVLDRSFLPGETAVIVPKTIDGRVIFMIPWLGHVLVGTTDTPIETAELEPWAQPQEIDFLLTTAGQYLTKQPQKSDILSVFTGIRPLVRKGQGASTSKLSRDHVIVVSDSGLITITGGKWTTARRMGEDCVRRAIKLAGLTESPCATVDLQLHGAGGSVASLYGTDAAKIEQLTISEPGLAKPLTAGYLLRGAEVVWAVRHEMARNVEDFLARRSRLLFLNVAAAESAAPEVARLMARELARDSDWEASQVNEFMQLATRYRC